MSPTQPPAARRLDPPQHVGDDEAAEVVETGETISPAEAAFERYRKMAGVVLAPAAFALTYALTPGLTPEGRRLAAILAAVAVMWVTEVIPLPVTALLGAALCVILGVAPAKQVLASFADPVVFVFIGGFMIARAMTVHALDRRIALSFLSIRFIGSHPARMLAGLGLVTAFLSMWISNTATTAMMLPIALGILSALHQVRVGAGLARGPMDARAWPFATGMMLMVAYAASLGGIGTPVGSPPNLIGIGLIREAAGVDISFFRWMAVAVPMMLLMGVALFTLLYLLHPAGDETIRAGFAAPGPAPATTDRPPRAGDGIDRSPDTLAYARGDDAKRGDGAVHPPGILDYVRGEYAKLGRWTAGQVCTLVAFLLAVTFWILPGVVQALGQAVGGDFGVRMTGAYKWFEVHLPESIVAIAAAVLLFMLPTNLRRGEFTLTWPDAVKIDWGTILLFGGGIALGGLMFSTGVAKALGEGLTSRLGVQSLWMLTGLSSAIAIGRSEAASTTAAATLIRPVVIALRPGAGGSPVPPALGAWLGASDGFKVPVSTPPNAIVYGSGPNPLPRRIRAGSLFDCVGFAVIGAGLRVLGPALGLV